MIATGTKRPRNLDAPRSAAILYGDWGTSKAYVVGLAFAVAGYSSFPLIAAMCLLTALVGVNYMTICKHYPDGGGVYASVRHRSEVISIIGAFLLIADYIVTAALSALSAFLYLGFSHPEIWAAVAIALIGGLNFFGPKHSAGLAFIVSIPTVIVVVILAAFCVPHLSTAVHAMAAHPLTGGLGKNWSGFVSIVLALSGVEAIANATGLMKLDPGSTDAKPSVIKTSTPALVWVMLEVCLFTALFGLAMLALPELQVVPSTDGFDVNAPGAEGVRDYMLRHMANVFVSGSLGATAGHFAGFAVSLVFGVLLLSAVNTALMDIISVTFLMSRDGEMPPIFSKLNKFGVPTAGMIFAAVIPVLLVLSVGDMSGLADLYAVGVVGAIATNLGASSTDKHLALTKWERGLMFFTFLLMTAIEISLFVEKPKARIFTLVLLVAGLILRGLAAERAQRKKQAEAATTSAAATAPLSQPSSGVAAALLGVNPGASSGEPMLCSVRGIGPTLDFAIDDAKKSDSPLYLLFVREQPALTPEDRKRKWFDDPEAREIFTYAAERADGHTILPCYAVSDSVADTIVDIAATVGTSRVILGAPRRNSLVNFLRGNLIRQVAKILPDEIHLLVYA